MKKLFYALFLLFCLPAMAQNRSALLYVGFKEDCKFINAWTVADIAQFDANTNGFIILPVNEQCSTTAVYLDNVMHTMDVVLQEKPGANIWISTPGSYQTLLNYHAITQPSALLTSDPIMDYLSDVRNLVISRFGQSVWNTRVRGIYLFDEGLTDNRTIDSGQFVYNLRDRIDSYYNNDIGYGAPLYKEMIWAPYWTLENGPDLDGTPNNIISAWLSYSNERVSQPGGYPLFDSIMIQSNLVLKAGPKCKQQDIDIKALINAFSLQDIRWWAINRQINGVYASDRTRIGVDMELTNAFKDSYWDDSLHCDTDPVISVEEGNNLKREETKTFYKRQIDVMGELIGSSTIDFTFYVSDKSWYDNEPRLYNCINNFYGQHYEVGTYAACMTMPAP